MNEQQYKNLLIVITTIGVGILLMTTLQMYAVFTVIAAHSCK